MFRFNIRRRSVQFEKFDSLTFTMDPSELVQPAAREEPPPPVDVAGANPKEEQAESDFFIFLL